MRARFYSPTYGRFISDDRIGLNGELNLHGYVDNDPIGHVDAIGLTKGLIDILVQTTISNVEGEPVNSAAVGGTAFFSVLGAIFSVGAIVSDPINDLVLLPFLAGAGIGTILNELIVDPLFFFALDQFGEFEPDPNIFGHDFGRDHFRKHAHDLRRSGDPNSKTASAGFGPANFVAADSLLPYRIDFENEATATAPAQRVDVADQLSDKLDRSTFQFTEVAFGDQFLAIPAGSQFFHTVVDVTPASGGAGFQVAIDLDFDSATGRVTAQFQAIDPATGLPFTGLTGFLPPEDGTGRGQAHFSYTVRPKIGLATGTEIRNVATIQFDFGEIINTNQADPHDPSKGTSRSKEALVTIDAGPPISLVVPLPAVSGPRIALHWAGADDKNGSGIDHYDVFVSDNRGPFVSYLTHTTLTSSVFPGVIGHTYRFDVLATDAVGHRQAAPANVATTRVVSRTPGDFDGDGKTDLATYRPSTDLWDILQSSNGKRRIAAFGLRNVDIPVPADYDGDGKSDVADYRPTTGQWLVLQSSNSKLTASAFGLRNRDIPTPGDFDGVGHAELAVYRPTTGQFLILQTGRKIRVVRLGLANVDRPVPADYDGDGKVDPAVYRPRTGQWIILQSSTGKLRVQTFGARNLDVPIPADYDGDGKADLTVYRPTTSQFLLLQSKSGLKVIPFGAAGKGTPVLGDYDGDGKADVAVYRPATGQFLIRQPTGATKVISFGAPILDVPVPTPLAYRYKGSLLRGARAYAARS